MDKKREYVGNLDSDPFAGYPEFRCLIVPKELIEGLEDKRVRITVEVDAPNSVVPYGKVVCPRCGNLANCLKCQGWIDDDDPGEER